MPSRRIAPDVGACTIAIARPVVDLPHPDSPTRPRVSPAATSRLTSETAWTRWRPVAELDHQVLDAEHRVGPAQVSSPAAGHQVPPDAS